MGRVDRRALADGTAATLCSSVAVPLLWQNLLAHATVFGVATTAIVLAPDDRAPSVPGLPEDD